MSKTNKDKRFFNIGGVFFLLIVIPLSLMAFLIANGMFKLGVTIKERTVNVLDNKVQEDEINLRKAELAGFLRETLKNSGIRIQTLINQNPQDSKPYTPVEKFKKMAEINPTLIKFKDQLDLEVDF